MRIILTIEDFICDLFDIRAGETLRALSMLLYIFFIISCLMIIKPVCNSLFLMRFGVANLPYAFILVALFAAGITAVYSKLLKRFSLLWLIHITLSGFCIILFVFWLLFRFNVLSGPALYVLYVVVAIFSVLSTSQFWSLANIIFNPREAKRLFGFIGSGAIVGGIFGGYITKLLAPVMGSENLISICILFIALCIPIASFLFRTSNTGDGDLSQMLRQIRHDTSLPSADHPLKMIMNSKHLIFLASILGISVLVAKLVEFQFSATAIAYIRNEDQLTAFFGFWLSNLNIASLLIQLFLTRRVVGILGVGTSLFFLPFSILFGAIMMLIYPSIGSAVFIKICDGSMKNSINKAGLELLVLPIPAAIKNQIKAFIDVFVDSFATGVGGILLLIVTSLLMFSPRQVSFLIIPFVGIWLYLVNRIRYEYIQSFRLKITDEILPQEEIKVNLKNETIFSSLIDILLGDNEDQVLKTLKMVKDIRNTRLIPCFKTLIHHPSTAVRLEVLKHIYYYKRLDFKDDVESLLSDPNLDITVEALHYLFNHTGAGRIKLLQSYLDHGDESLRIAAMLCAIRESRNNTRLKNVFNIQKTIIALFLEAGRSGNSKKKVICARAIGAANMSELSVYLHILLHDSSREVVKAALAGAGEFRRVEFIPILIYFLGQDDVQQVAANSLVSFGSGILDTLDERLKNSYVDITIRRYIPGVIARFGTQKSSDILVKYLDHPDITFRYAVIRALNRLRIDFPDLYINDQKIVRRIFSEAKDFMNTLSALYHHIKVTPEANSPEKPLSGVETSMSVRLRLIHKLEERLDDNLERIFRLLGLKYPPQDIFNVYKGIKSHSQDMRMNAVEFLDNVLEASLKKVIIPIIETPIIHSLMNGDVEQLGIKAPNEFEGLALLLSIEDRELQAIALELIKTLGDENYISLVGEKLASPDPVINALAMDVLKRFGF